MRVSQVNYIIVLCILRNDILDLFILIDVFYLFS